MSIVITDTEATLAIATVTGLLAGATLWTGWNTRKGAQDTKSLAEDTKNLAEASKEQNNLLRQQFDLSIRPSFVIYTGPASSQFSQVFEIVLKNVGKGLAKDVEFTVFPPGGQIVSLRAAILQPNDELTHLVSYDPSSRDRVLVSVRGAKDILDRPVPEITGQAVEYPPIPSPSTVPPQNMSS